MSSVKAKILEFAKKNNSFATKDVLTFLKHKYSRQYIVQTLRKLMEEGEIVKTGRTNRTKYWYKSKFEASGQLFKKAYINKGLEEYKVFQEIESAFSILKLVSENVHSIFVYAFSEMFNNAIEHSKSKKIDVTIVNFEDSLRFTVRDYGIGVFRNIMKKKKLASELESIQELMKGKVTTQPKSHSGEGIFFTSKVGESFVLNSYDYQLRVDNSIDDVFVKKMDKEVKGTEVIFDIELTHEGHLNEVFEKYYTDPDELAFDKTEVRVKLYTMGTVYISRSQARRVLSRLENFKKVILDFDQVPTVGQAFADEVFRVFKLKHPEVEILPDNMNDAVAFMVGRVAKE